MSQSFLERPKPKLRKSIANHKPSSRARTGKRKKTAVASKTQKHHQAKTATRFEKKTRHFSPGIDNTIRTKSKSDSAKKHVSNTEKFWFQCAERDRRKLQQRLRQTREPTQLDRRKILRQFASDSKQLSAQMKKMTSANVEPESVRTEPPIFPQRNRPRSQSQSFGDSTEHSRSSYFDRRPTSTSYIQAYWNKRKYDLDSLKEKDAKSDPPIRPSSQSCKSVRTKSRLENVRPSTSSATKFTGSFEFSAVRNRLKERWEDMKRDVDQTYENFHKKQEERCRHKHTRISTKQIDDDKMNREPLQAKRGPSGNNAPRNQQPQSNFVNRQDQFFSVGDFDELANFRADLENLVPHEEESRRHSMYTNIQSFDEDYGHCSVRELKEQLSNLNVESEIVVEKTDLINKLKQELAAEKSKSASPSMKSDCKDDVEGQKEKSNTRDRVDEWILKWSHRRSLRQLLNSILGVKPSEKGYLRRGSDLTSVTKAYRKAMLRIHPDKHVNGTYEHQYKASEMFKIVSSLYDKHKKRHSGLARLK